MVDINMRFFDSDWEEKLIEPVFFSEKLNNDKPLVDVNETIVYFD